MLQCFTHLGVFLLEHVSISYTTVHFVDGYKLQCVFYFNCMYICIVYNFRIYVIRRAVHLNCNNF